MSPTLGKCRPSRVARLIVFAAVTIGVLLPKPAAAQQDDVWRGTFSPFYFWATRIDGEITARTGSVPVFMTFEDAADKLAGAFSFHLEARKNRFGLFSDLNFVRLSTETSFVLQGPFAVVVEGDADVDNTFFEAGASYLLSETTNVAVIGGLRTFTVSTKFEYSTPNVSVTPIDANRTAVSGFAGITYRPEISEKLSFISRADIGGGSGLSWSGLLGLEFRPKPWAGLVLGYKAMGIDFGKESDDEELRQVDLTYYGPIFGLNFHWGGR